MAQRNATRGEQVEIHTVTRDLVRAIIEDEWPSWAAEIDFGIASPAHFGALQHAVKCEGVTLEELDAALGSGERIQALISLKNPYRNVVFSTLWDDLAEEPEGF